MEHPVPQNVTSFEFHLIGDMTLKQFGYLAGGLAVAYLSFTVLLPVNSLLAIPLLILAVLTGAALAFLPILDRPLDHWVLAFFRAVYSPTRGFWKMPGSQDKADNSNPLFKNRLQRYLSGLGVPTPTVTTPPPSFPKISRLIPPAADPSPAPQPAPPVPPASQNPPNPIIAAEGAHVPPPAPSPNPDYQNKLQDITSNLQDLVKQAENLSRPVSQVTVVEPLKKPKTQIALTSLPNVINGIITDHQGNYLEGVIVIIHNSEGLPVRALKTNKLGQFSGATPLPSGTYTITLEKEGVEFNTLQITLTGEMISPLSISPKGG